MLFHKKEKKADRKNDRIDRKNYWSMNQQGSLCFTTGEDIDRLTYQPDSIFSRQEFTALVMILCAALDFAMFYGLFSMFLNEYWYLRAAAILALLIGFDVGPIFLGESYRKKKEGYRVDSVVMTGLIVAFIVGFLVNACLRIAAKDLVLPANAFTGEETNPLALPWALFGIIAPFITSVVSFGVSYMNYHPLRNERRKLEQSILRLEDEILQEEAILADYDAEEDHLLFLSKCDLDRYTVAARSAKNHGVYLCNLARERLKEHLGEPSSTNELSKEACFRVMDELEKTIQKIQSMDASPMLPSEMEETAKQQEETGTSSGLFSSSFAASPY